MRHYPIPVATQFQRDNLKTLGLFLYHNAERLSFTMNQFCPSGRMRPEAVGCNTVGCAVGHGPLAGIKPLKHELWMGYSDRVFGTGWSPGPSQHFLSPQDIFEWLFTTDWVVIDNTPKGTAKRILYTLEHGIPEDFKKQLRGEAPLSYKDFEVTE